MQYGLSPQVGCPGDPVGSASIAADVEWREKHLKITRF